MTQQNNNVIVNLIWQIADDILRDIYVKTKYRDVILPMTVIARIDSELVESKEKVLQEYEKFKDKITNIEPILKKATGYSFYNISPFTLQSLLKDPANIRANFKQYLNGYSSNIQDIVSKFEFENQMKKLEDADILFALIQKFVDSIDKISPKNLSNHDMGYVFEELIRKFNAENNEEAGEHFTPREVIKLMTNLVFLPVQDQIKDRPITIYDPCVGSGGMLSVAKEFIQGEESKIHSTGNIFTFGQEINPETYALCKADMLLKGERDNQVAFGSTLSNDGFSNEKFDFILTNPPYGKSWKLDQDKLASGKKKEILDPRFRVGTPRINDGQLLFILHMISKMKHDTPLGTRIASVHNGSALFTGDAGGGESEIRKHIIENDYLEAIIALPKELFYNTGIGTYIWIITNRKPKERKGKIQLINSVSEKFYTKLTKSLGNKRVELKDIHIEKIFKLFEDFKENEYSKIFDNDDFGYTQVVIERPQYDEKGEKILKKGNPIPDTELRDKESIPLKEDIQEYFNREVLPFAPDAWMDRSKDKVGYEINFNKYFYEYTPPRDLIDIAKDILALENETDGVLKEIIEN
ncbi:MAG: class I SAM-dependent DNA methyltransferase [Candidatus Gracilibacteria bacterium]|nr:class I SAM-dependent DNA methyltransferase [Candidatus Gracilibacteria bacterium]